MCMLFDKNLVSIYNSCIFGFETGFMCTSYLTGLYKFKQSFVGAQ